MSHWAQNAIFYHLYPLGLTGAPERNDFGSQPVPRLEGLLPWADHVASLGANAVYLGPVFESSTHGYDTADYRRIDRRLGTGESMRRLVDAFHERGIRVVLDAVFHHTGRDFPAFRDLIANRDRSTCRDWYDGVDFSGTSPFGDPFGYTGWRGCFDLVKLNLGNPEVREHLFGSIDAWIREYDIDGLRLDAADLLDRDFLEALAGFRASRKPDLWLLGEVIHGDYRGWVRPGGLDSVTNYECWKGLWSSFNDGNLHEIAWSLNRQFGDGGIYRGMPLYSFADNHDVDRVASLLNDPAHLYPLTCLLFTMPGIPSVYYGSEYGIAGRKAHGGDSVLRPALDLDELRRQAPHPDLASAVRRLARIRGEREAVRTGTYRQLLVGPRQLGFLRGSGEDAVLVLVNAAAETAEFHIDSPGLSGPLHDLLNDQPLGDGSGPLNCSVPPNRARIIVRTPG